MAYCVAPYSIPYEFITHPPSDHLQSTVYIKHVEIRENMVQRFSYERHRTSLLCEYLMQVTGPHAIDRVMTITFKRQNRRDNTNHCHGILQRGVELSGAIFYYFGHSNSQLKDKTCYLMHASRVEIHELLAQFANFSNISKLDKRAKRIGLLFSGFNNSVSLRVGEYADFDDIEHRGYNFTDGCGLMSEDFTREVQRSHRLKHQPSVLQIRYQGYKGVLLHFPELQGVKVMFRKSMKKFFIPDEVVSDRCTTLGVVEYSKPYSNAFLNTQLVMVLADNHGARGRHYLLQLQNDFYDTLRNLCRNEETARHYLTITGRTDLLSRLHKQGIAQPRVRSDLENIRRGDVKKMLKDDNVGDINTDGEQKDEIKSKLRVLVPKARVVFGVSDPYNELEYGEVFFKPSLPDIEFAAFYDATEVVVGRNPCYHPGDIRVLKLAKAEDKLRYAHLFDCIVFPVKGPRPHPHECSGGDLDGDKYFVSWDKRLVPEWVTDPFEYDQTSPINFAVVLGNILQESVLSPVTNKVLSMGRSYLPRLFGTKEQAIQRQKFREREKLQTYFACYENDLVCRVNAIFMKYAARYGPSCSECLKLNEFFSDAVDMNADRAKVEDILRDLEFKFRQRWRALQYANPNEQIHRRRHDTSSEEESWLHYACKMMSNPTKTPFMEGDDVWTTMEQNAERFVQEMQRYL